MIGYAAGNARDSAADFGVVRDELHACDELTESQLKSFRWTRRYTRDQWLDQLLSQSDHPAFDLKVREMLCNEICRTIDRFGGTFHMEHLTVLISATRK